MFNCHRNCSTDIGETSYWVSYIDLFGNLWYLLNMSLLSSQTIRRYNQMNYCKHCGNHLADSQNFCSMCGCVVEKSSVQNQTGVLEQIQNDNSMLMSVLSYIFILIPLLTGAYKTSDVVKFHLNQGVVLCISCLIWSIIRAVLGGGLSFIPYFYRWIITIPINLIWVGFASLFVVGVLNAVNGRMKPLPLIGRFTIIK